jgi:LacI family transcriptional regulator
MQFMVKALSQALLADKLNLAAPTVSRALRGHPGINPDTRKRVLAMAEKLGYNLAPRRPRRDSSKHMALGVLIQSPMGSWAQANYLVGLSSSAARLNVSLILHHVVPDECEKILDHAYQPPAMRDGSMKGLCLIYRWPERVVEQLARKFACVSIIHRYPNAAIDLIDMDHRGGMLMLAEHLRKLGHKKIGFFGLNDQVSWSWTRYIGYVEAMLKFGLPLNPDWAIRVPEANLEDRTQSWNAMTPAAIKLARQGVTAWMAASEWAGHILARAFMEAGLKVPQDVSVTGFDNTDTSVSLEPRLTSTSVPVVAMGSEALVRLKNRIEEPDSPIRCNMFFCNLVTKGSTGPAV